MRAHRRMTKTTREKSKARENNERERERERERRGSLTEMNDGFHVAEPVLATPIQENDC